MYLSLSSARSEYFLDLWTLTPAPEPGGGDFTFLISEEQQDNGERDWESNNILNSPVYSFVSPF